MPLTFSKYRLKALDGGVGTDIAEGVFLCRRVGLVSWAVDG